MILARTQQSVQTTTSQQHHSQVEKGVSCFQLSKDVVPGRLSVTPLRPVPMLRSILLAARSWQEFLRERRARHRP
jgi:hypothetical protein